MIQYLIRTFFLKSDIKNDIKKLFSHIITVLGRFLKHQKFDFNRFLKQLNVHSYVQCTS